MCASPLLLRACAAKKLCTWQWGHSIVWPSPRVDRDGILEADFIEKKNLKSSASCHSHSHLPMGFLHRLKMELDLQSLFRLLCTAVLIGWDPATLPPPPRIWAHRQGALLVSQDRQHLFVTPWFSPSCDFLTFEFSTTQLLSNYGVVWNVFFALCQSQGVEVKFYIQITRFMQFMHVNKAEKQEKDA